MINLPCWHLSAWKGAKFSTILLLLSLLFVAGSAGAEQPPRLTLAAEQGSVPAGEPLRLVQSGLYSLSAGVGEGLAVSPDGRWLFGLASRRMYVWQIDSAGAVLTPANPPMYEHPSLSGGGLAVSPNGRFVFASGRDDITPSNSALSVWRLNSEAGTLTMTADYREGGVDAAGSTITGLAGIFDVVLNADGSLLFVTSGGGVLSVWRVDNSSGTLAETEVYESTAGDNSLGLLDAAGAALSPDGSLLFVGTFPTSALFDTRSRLSVWRVNAEEGTPTVTHLMTHRDDQRLSRPRYVAVSPSGLLLVSSQFSRDVDSLSIWRARADDTGAIMSLGSYNNVLFSRGDPGAVGATAEVVISAGLFNDALFLFRIDEDGNGSSFVERYDDNADAFTYRDGNPRISADRPIGVTASPAGGLVFTGGFRGPVTAWRVEGIPRVPAGQEVRVTVNADPAPMAALAVTVEARQGSRAVTALATFNPQEATAQAVFAGGALGPGEWIFSASSASTADVSAARGTVRINSPDVRLENLSGRVREAESLEIKVIASASLPKDVMVTVRGRRGSATIAETGLLSTGQTSLSVTFESIPEEGDWTFSAVPRLPLVTAADDTALAVSIGPPLPQLTLVPAAPDFALDSDVVISVSATGALDSDVMVTVSADSGSASDSLEVMLLRGDGTSPPAAVLARFPAGTLDEGTYTIMAGMASVDDVAADAMTTTIRVRRAVLRLSLQIDEDTLLPRSIFLSEEEVTFLIQPDIVPGISAAVTPRAVRADQTPAEGMPITLSADADTAVNAVFPAGTLAAGLWTVTASGAPDIFDSGELSVEVLAQPVNAFLSTEQTRLRVGIPFQLALSLESTFQNTFAVQLRTVPDQSAGTLSRVLTIPSGQMTGSAMFTLPAAGTYLFESSSSILNLPPLEITAVMPMLELSVPPSASAGSTVLATVTANFSLPDDITVEVLARQYRAERQAQVVLRSGSSAGDAVFQAEDGNALGPGPWLLRIESVTSVTSEFPISHNLQTAISVDAAPLTLAAMQVGSAVQVLVATAFQAASTATITVTARQGDTRYHRTAVLEPLAMEVRANFEEDLLSAGAWTFLVSEILPVGIFDATAAQAELLVRVVPSLRFEPVSAEVPAGLSVPVLVRADNAPGRAITLEITATAVGETTRTASVSLEAESTEAELGLTLPAAGIWTLTMTADPAEAVQGEENARATVTVTAPVLSLRPAASRYLPNTDVTLNAEASAELAAEAIIMVQAARVDGQPSPVSPVSVTLGPGAQSSPVIFVGGLPSLGDWRFTAQSVSNAVDVTEASATLTVGNPMLRLMPSEPRYGPLDDVVINVEADTAPDTEVTVTVQAARADSQPSSVSSMSVTLGPTTQSSLVTFSGLLLAPGEWLFTAQPSSDAVDVAGATASATVEEATLRLERVEEQYSTPPVEILVRTNFPLNGNEIITITADNPEFSLMRSTSIVLTAVGATAMTVDLTSLLSSGGGLRNGRWVLSTLRWTFTGLGENQAVAPSPPITVFIGLSRLSLALPAGITAGTIASAGSTLGVTVLADFPPRADAEVTVQAVRAISATATAFAYTATTAVAINAGEGEWMALFGGDNALAPGQWIFTITRVQRPAAALFSSRELRRIIGPPSLSLSAAEFVLGQNVVISVNTDVSLRTELRTTVTATLEGSLDPAISRSVVLQPDALSVELTFAADVLSAGRWRFQIAQADPLFLVTDQDLQLPLVDVTTASLVLDLMPALVLEPPPTLVGAGQDVSIGVQASAPLSEAATVILMAEQQFGGQTLHRTARAELAVSGTATTAVFTGPNGLLSGTWTLTATVVPMTAAAAPPPAMVTVDLPRLRLLRLGPTSAAAGTAVTVRVTADAMPLSGEFRVTASRPDRPNVEIAGALAPPDLSAEVEFPALSPGEWLLTVAAELPGTLSTGGAVDEVVVGPIALILTAKRERVPASEPVALTLSGPVSPGIDVAVSVIGRRTDISPQQAIALGTTVTVTLSADATRLKFNYQLTPGQWAITAQPQNSEVASASEALNVVVQKPLLRLQPVRYEIEAGSPLRVRVISEVALSEALSVTVLARQHGEERTAEAVLESRSETADFYAEAEGEALFSAQDGNALGPGSWILRVAKTTPTGLVNSTDARAAVTVSASLMELAAEQRGSMVEVRVSAEAMPTRPVTIMVTARRASDPSEQYTRSALLEASALAVQVIFEPDLLSAGLWIFSVTEISPTGILDAASATAELQVLPFLRLLEPQDIPADGSAEVTVLASSLLERAADITVTALRGEREVAASVRMESGQSSATVQFDAGVLSAGEWLLSISVPPAAAASVQVSAESVTLVVAAPVVSFEPAMIQVPNGRPATVTVTSAGAPGQEVALRITATAADGATRAVTVSLAAEAMSAEGQLLLPSAGIWALTMTADPDTAVQGEEQARGTVEVTVPALTLLSLRPRYGPADTAVLVVEASAAPSAEVTVMVMAARVDGTDSSVEPMSVVLGPSTLSAQAFFPVSTLYPDGSTVAISWRFTAMADPNVVDARGASVDVTAVRPVILLAWSRRVYLSDQVPTLRITVTNADLGVPADLTLTPVPHPSSPAAVPLPSAESFSIEIGAGESVEWPRPGLPTGLLRFMATLNPDVATLAPAVLDLRVRDAGARIPVDLSVVPPEVFQGDAVMVRAAIPEITGVGLDLRLYVTAPNGEQTPLEILISEGTTSALITHVLDLPGRFVFHVPGDEGVTEATTVSAFATVPELSLSVPAGLQEPVSAGSTVGVVVSATRSPLADLSVTVQATRINSPVFREVTRAVTVMMSAEEEEVTALFGGENVLSPGRWSFAIAAIMPEGMAAASTGQVQLTVGASVLSLSAMSEAVPQALPLRIDINTEVALEVRVEIEVMATRQGEPVMILDRIISLLPDALSAELVFEANELALGRWRFEVIEFTPRFLGLSPEEPLLDITAASLELDLRATLTLEPPSAAVETGQDVAIGVRSSGALSEDVTVILMAERLFNGTTLGRTVTAELAAASTATTAVFSGPNALLPGFWTLTARVMPATAAIAPSPAAVTVQAPRLRLERLGPPSVAAGTPVALRVTANAMPEVDGFFVTARQPGRPDVVQRGMLGEDLSAQLEFPSLSSGEWFLAATAEVPGALLDGSAIDTVTVEAIALSLVPRQPTVQATEQAVLVLSSVRSLGVDVDVLVTAEIALQFSRATRQVTRMVSIDGDAISTEIVYSPGELTPGEWIFSVQASTATRMVADLSATTTTLRVNAALLSIAAAQARFAATGSVALGMTATARPGQGVRVILRATLADSQVVFSPLAFFAAEQTAATAEFGVGALVPGDWTFIVTSTDPSGLLDGTAAVATATVVMPVLSLELTQFNFLVTEPTEIPVSLNIAPGIPLVVTVVATQSGANAVTADLRLGAAEREGIVIFPVGSLTAGEWTLVSNAPSVVASSPVVVQLLETAIPATALEIEGTDSVQAGEAVTLAVTLAEAVSVPLSLQVIARDPDGETRTPVDILVATGQTSGSASYTLESRSGIWQFLLLTQGSISVSGDGLATSATVVSPVLSLQTGVSPVPLGTAVEVTLRVSALTYLELEVQIQARMTVPAAMTRTVSVVLGPTSPSVSVEFAGENMLSRGEWVISIMDASPSTAVRLSTAGVTVEVGAPLLSLAPVSRDVVVGSPVEIEVLSTAPLEGAVEVTMIARQPNRESEELTVMLGASERSVSAVFAGEQRLLTGEWSFAITDVAPPLNADFSDQAVSITVNPPVLTLLPPALPAEPESDVEVGIRASVPPGEDIVLRVIATRMVGQRLLTREAEAMLGASAQSASVVFRAGENGLLPGVWTLTATANLPLPVSVQMVTVSVLIPQITLDILGLNNNPWVQAGTRVELQVTASAAPAVPIAVTVRGTQSEREDELALPVMLQAGTLTQVAEFPSLPPGEWSFSVIAVDIDPPGELMPTDGPAPRGYGKCDNAGFRDRCGGAFQQYSHSACTGIRGRGARRGIGCGSYRLSAQRRSPAAVHHFVPGGKFNFSLRRISSPHFGPGLLESIGSSRGKLGAGGHSWHPGRH